MAAKVTVANTSTTVTAAVMSGRLRDFPGPSGFAALLAALLFTLFLAWWWVEDPPAPLAVDGFRRGRGRPPVADRRLLQPQTGDQ